MDLCVQDTQSNQCATFLWHRYLKESTKEMGARYRAFVDACTAGPIPSASTAQILMGTSELGDADKEDVKLTQELLMTLRRKTVSFVALPSVGGASGADYTKAQMDKMWETMRLGHKYGRKKTDVRAFVLSADLFPPNVAKHGVRTSMSEPIAVDADRMKRVIDFILQKRTKDDLILLFDGRSRSCRRVMEQSEEKLAASGAHAVTECWFVFVVPSKTEDPRVPGKQASFVSNNKEVAICTWPTRRGWTKVVHRAEFNTCGESSTSSTTYTGVPMRRYSELPRMDFETKESILGVAASGALPGRRAQKDIEERGHPFSHCEVKPLSLWQRICEHHHVTHIIDFAAGSAALAIAAAGAMEYEGVAANDVHREWLDSTLDRCVMYMAGKEKQLARKKTG